MSTGKLDQRVPTIVCPTRDTLLRRERTWFASALDRAKECVANELSSMKFPLPCIASVHIPQLSEPNRVQLRLWLADGGYKEDVVFNAHPDAEDTQILLTFRLKQY